MIKLLISQFISNQECNHNKITPDLEAGYCPDCGKYIENHWFITRCACCGIKQKTIILKNKISPAAKFCRNCGHNEFIIQQLNKINFVDIHYAAVTKKIIKDRKPYLTQSWVEESEENILKFLPGNLTERTNCPQQ